MSDEWLTADLIAEAFCNFLKQEPLSDVVAWREITGLVS